MRWHGRVRSTLVRLRRCAPRGARGGRRRAVGGGWREAFEAVRHGGAWALCLSPSAVRLLTSRSRVRGRRCEGKGAVAGYASFGPLPQWTTTTVPGRHSPGCRREHALIEARVVAAERVDQGAHGVAHEARARGATVGRHDVIVPGVVRHRRARGNTAERDAHERNECARREERRQSDGRAVAGYTVMTRPPNLILHATIWTSTANRRVVAILRSMAKVLALVLCRTTLGSLEKCT